MFSRKILIFYVLFSIFSLSAEESAFATFVQGKAIYYGSRGFVLGVAKMIGMDKPTQIERGHIFEKGNFILVGNGKVDVTYKEGPVISLLKDSKYTVGDKSGELDNGSLFFNNKKADDKDFKIDVKTYTVGVRGTEFLLDMNGVYVRQGEVEVTKKAYLVVKP
ncbi:MAG: FecR domain-containing protein [Leptospiraceae bacterium]|nr:FecR domain-containing protein [Leptospiraceae bacterium]